MNNNCCMPEDIFRLNDSKEYVLLSQSILELVVTDNRLCAQTTKLWQFLYAKSKFDSNLSLTISYACLANALGKSVRTISRYIANLEEFGYLQVTANYDGRGSRLANTLLVRIPEAALSTLNAKKDRRETLPVSAPPDKTDNVLPDNSGITNNIININTNNNNITVVDLKITDKPETMFHVEQSLEHEMTDSLEPEDTLPAGLIEIKHEIKALEMEYHNVDQVFKQSDATKQSELFPNVLALQSKLDTLRLHYNNQLKRWQAKQKQHKQSESLLHNDNYMLAREGQRVFNAFEINRLKKGLQSLCLREKLPQLLNEVTFAIRFGELQKEQGTGKLLDIQHGISIALKLVREGRWKTPKGLLISSSEAVGTR